MYTHKAHPQQWRSPSQKYELVPLVDSYGLQVKQNPRLDLFTPLQPVSPHRISVLCSRTVGLLEFTTSVI